MEPIARVLSNHLLRTNTPFAKAAVKLHIPLGIIAPAIDLNLLSLLCPHRDLMQLDDFILAFPSHSVFPTHTLRGNGSSHHGFLGLRDALPSPHIQALSSRSCFIYDVEVSVVAVVGASVGVLGRGSSGVDSCHPMEDEDRKEYVGVAAHEADPARLAF